MSVWLSKKEKGSKNYDHIVFEDLQIKNMVQNPKLAKSIMDAGWGQLIRFTAYKTEFKDLSVRIHVCPECGLILKRDHVSAILIANTVAETGSSF